MADEERARVLIGAARQGTGECGGERVGVLMQVLNMQCVSDLTGVRKRRHVRFISRLQGPLID